MKIENSLEATFAIFFRDFRQAKHEQTVQKLLYSLYSIEPCYAKRESDKADEASKELRRKEEFHEYCWN